MTDIKSVKEVLNLDNLSIPSFQRPYKWGTKSVIELLEDIEIDIISAERNKDFKYRIGTIILYKNSNDSKKEIIDGQQRLITLSLIYYFLDKSAQNTCKLLNESLTSEITKYNLYYNFQAIKEWFSLKDNNFKEKFFKCI